MPLIVVYGLREEDFDGAIIDMIERTITRAVLEISELELTKDDISFSFPRDPSVESETIPVAIIIELLFKKSKRTDEVRQRLAESVARAFKALPGNESRMIEVAVKRFDPEKDGFCMIKPTEG